MRNIPDILVSLFWQHKTQVKPAYSGDISCFIRDPIYGVEKAIAFFNLWYENKNHVQGLMLLRYEDLLLNTKYELVKLLKYLNIELHESIIDETISFGKFENIRQLELNNIKTKELVLKIQVILFLQQMIFNITTKLFMFVRARLMDIRII